MAAGGRQRPRAPDFHFGYPQSLDRKRLSRDLTSPINKYSSAITVMTINREHFFGNLFSVSKYTLPAPGVGLDPVIFFFFFFFFFWGGGSLSETFS